MNKVAFTALVAYVLIFAAVIIFPGGKTPHWVNVGNRTTVVAYTNGLVYADGDLAGGKRTLWRAKNGNIMSSLSVVGAPGFYEQVSIPATPAETTVWSKAQTLLDRR